MNDQLMLLEMICRPKSTVEGERQFSPLNEKTDPSMRILEAIGIAFNIIHALGAESG